MAVKQMRPASSCCLACLSFPTPDPHAGVARVGNSAHARHPNLGAVTYGFLASQAPFLSERAYTSRLSPTVQR